MILLNALNNLSCMPEPNTFIVERKEFSLKKHNKIDRLLYFIGIVMSAFAITLKLVEGTPTS